jgi:hypothetical protein
MTGPREVSTAMAIGAIAKALSRFGYPLVEGFGSLLQLNMLGFGALSRPDPQVMLLVGPI